MLFVEREICIVCHNWRMIVLKLVIYKGFIAVHLVAVVVVSFLLQKSPRIFPIIITRLTLSPIGLKNAFLSTVSMA